MATVKVRPKEGRRAFYEGKELAPDKWTQVNETEQIVRLRDHWGDIEQEGFSAPAHPIAASQPRTRPRPTNPAAKE